MFLSLPRCTVSTPIDETILTAALFPGKDFNSGDKHHEKDIIIALNNML